MCVCEVLDEQASQSASAKFWTRCNHAATLPHPAVAKVQGGSGKGHPPSPQSGQWQVQQLLTCFGQKDCLPVLGQSSLVRKFGTLAAPQCWVMQVPPPQPVRHRTCATTTTHRGTFQICTCVATTPPRHLSLLPPAASPALSVLQFLTLLPTTQFPLPL